MSARVAVIVVAAGSGTRLGLATPKAFVDLGEQTLLERSVRSIAQAHIDAQIIAVVPAEMVDIASEICEGALGQSGATDDGSIGISWVVVPGGVMRHDSVVRGLAVLEGDVQTVLVHDAARALTPPAVFEDVVRAVVDTGQGVVASLPVIDSIKSVDAHGHVLADVDRSTLAAMQTPQGFPRAELEQAYSNAEHANYTDDAAVFTAAGFQVRTVTGDSASFKITTPDDLARAELMIGAEPRIGLTGALTAELTDDLAGVDMRVGTGVDTHAFTDDPSVELKLAGLLWPGERGLSGHSDGDAVAHAICDALLTAAGLGDIGTVFGTDDPRFAGASGDVFVTHAVSLLSDAGYDPVNVTVQIIGNRPRLSGRRAEAETTLSEWVGAPVSVSATTTDGLGFTGRGEGIAAVATALIRARR